MKNKLQKIRENYPDIIFISFPGDEKTSGGCLAAGRGFFHINSHGGAEPCPFSPYSDINVKNTSLKEAIHSKLFQKLQNQSILMEEHSGGCVLFEKKEQVEALL
jgi:MoaA/NifB/PqqE/SkfB family radical SAM enzyme